MKSLWVFRVILIRQLSNSLDKSRLQIREVIKEDLTPIESTFSRGLNQSSFHLSDVLFHPVWISTEAIAKVVTLLEEPKTSTESRMVVHRSSALQRGEIPFVSIDNINIDLACALQLSMEVSMIRNHRPPISSLAEFIEFEDRLFVPFIMELWWWKGSRNGGIIPNEPTHILECPIFTTRREH